MLEIIKEWLKAKFHAHNWETIEEHTTRVFEDDYQSRPVKVKKVYIQRCKICNKIRQFRIEL